MPPYRPALGSQAIYSPTSDTRSVNIDPSTCHNLSMFKELMKEYRKVDDTVTMRLNRTAAQFRDRARTLSSGTSKNSGDEACAYFWQDLVANWKRRSEIIQYCAAVVDQSLDNNRNSIENVDLSSETRKELRLASFEEEVKRNQIHNELTVEAIIRRRSFEAFRSRCRYFEPPLSDTEARKWWDMAQHDR